MESLANGGGGSKILPNMEPALSTTSQNEKFLNRFETVKFTSVLNAYIAINYLKSIKLFVCAQCIHIPFRKYDATSSA